MIVVGGLWVLRICSIPGDQVNSWKQLGRVIDEGLWYSWGNTEIDGGLAVYGIEQVHGSLLHKPRCPVGLVSEQ